MTREIKILLGSLVIMVIVLALNIFTGTIHVLSWQQLAGALSPKVPPQTQIVGYMHHHENNKDGVASDVQKDCGAKVAFGVGQKLFTTLPGEHCSLSSVEILPGSVKYAVKVLPDGPILTSPGSYNMTDYGYNDQGTGVLVTSGSPGGVLVDGIATDGSNTKKSIASVMLDSTRIVVGKLTSNVSVGTHKILYEYGVVESDDDLRYDTCLFDSKSKDCNIPKPYKQIASCTGTVQRTIVCSATIKVESDKVTKLNFENVIVKKGAIGVSYIISGYDSSNTKSALDIVNVRNTPNTTFYDVIPGEHQISIITPVKSKVYSPNNGDIKDSYLRYEICNDDKCSDSSGKMRFDSVAPCTVAENIQTCTASVDVTSGQLTGIFFKRFSAKSLPEVEIKRPVNYCAVVSSEFKPDLEIKFRDAAGNKSGAVNVSCDGKVKEKISLNKTNQPYLTSPCTFGSGEHEVAVSLVGGAVNAGSNAINVRVAVPGKIEVKDPIFGSAVNNYSKILQKYLLDKGLSDPKTGEIFLDKLNKDLIDNGAFVVSTINGVDTIHMTQKPFNEKFGDYLSHMGFNLVDRGAILLALSLKGAIHDGIVDSTKALALIDSSIYTIDGKRYANYCKNLVK